MHAPLRTLAQLALAGLMAWGSAGAVAAVVVIPDASLLPSTALYSNDFGAVVVTTGGGNAANVDDPSGRNDDGFRGPIALGYTLRNFFGQDYTDFFLNTNGNITFQSGLPDFTPAGPQGATQPVIAPYFADVDTRHPDSGRVHLNQSIAHQTLVTWDRVGYFNARADKLATFQLVLRGPDFVVPAGEGQIGFFWGEVEWETGEASGGVDGFGGSPAAVGFGDGQSRGFVLESSTQDGISQVVSNRQLWFNLNARGEPVPVAAIPEPGTHALMLAGLLALAWQARRRRG